MLSVVLAGFSGVDSSILYLSCQGKGSQNVFGIYNSLGTVGLLIAAAVFSLFVQDNYALAGLLTAISYGLAALLSLGITEVKPVKKMCIRDRRETMDSTASITDQIRSDNP